MPQDTLIKTLERALFMARNGKITSFVGALLDDQGNYKTIYELDDEDDAISMVGALEVLKRDMMTVVPIVQVSDLGESLTDEENFEIDHWDES